LDHRKYVIAIREKAKVGPKGFQQLLLSFGSVENVFKASIEDLSSLPRMTPQKAEQLLSSQEDFREIENRISYLEELGVGISTLLDDNYPGMLKQINDPPPLLYYRGDFPLADPSFVAVVGTHREYSSWGVNLAVQIGKHLARNEVVVVSGLAEGIDSAAHVGAIQQEGKTYAVLGSGLNKIYPGENVTLAKEITQHGALITEYDLDVPVKVGQLMARNRIVVGLSQAVILVEMNENKSEGTMNAAEIAIEQGKPLYVMRKENSRKVEELAAEGAVILEGVDDLDMVVQCLF
jgi:DNA processing protein